MLSVIEGQPIPSNGSSKLVAFNCDCGQTNILKKWKHFASGHVKSCGKCSLLTRDHFEKTQYGKLKMKNPMESQKGSNKKVYWICDCGRETLIPISWVTSQNTSSCGKCGILVKSHWEETKYGKLRMKSPEDASRTSHKKVEWLCDCGRETISEICNVTLGKTMTCGKCNLIEKEYFENTKFGKLKMKNPVSSKPGSEKIEIWVCDCGRETKTKICYVIGGETTSCGKCHVREREYWESSKFGRLGMKVPKDISPESHEKVTWKCDCGGESEAYIFNVSRGSTTNCGKCGSIAYGWYRDNEEKILSLKTPIKPEEVPDGWIKLCETVTHVDKPVSALCGSCKSAYKPVWSNIKLGRSLTCGCTTNRISYAQREIAQFISSNNKDVSLEHNLGGLKYDIKINSEDTVIEYNGLHWHSGELSRKRDLRKYKKAKSEGFKYVMIFEDEWKEKQEIIEDNLKYNICKNSSARTMRPSECEIKEIKSCESSSFYERYHYIGACKSKINYGVFHQDRLIACMSFKRPTRQTSKFDFELIRMASDPEFRIHGIWSKLLGKFIKDHKPKSIVSFSDNRLFSGNVYEKIGFKYDGEIPPDYYWVKNGKRFHKSGLRKPKGYKATETELREEQGYRKIWDLGKKRWVMVMVYSPHTEHDGG